MNPINGTNGNDTLSGGLLNDIINGFAGNDRLYGRAGNDILNGGAGNDRLYGGAGNDTLNGGTGHDILNGGLGNDTYIVDSLNDQIIEVSNAGTDTVRSSISWTLAAYLENLILTGTRSINGTGNSLNNIIWGNSAANTLNGGAGNDTLNGGAGNDRLYGGVGNDTLNGGNGDDRLYGGTGNDTLNGGNGNDILDGGTGNDILKGGGGNDAYIVDTLGDQIIETANAGIDTVNSSVNWILADNFENLTLTGTATQGTGNSLNNVITGNGEFNTLAGGAGNDTLYGGVGNDTLDGGTGNDTLVGGDWMDFLTGGEGNDTLTGGTDRDIFSFGSPNQGTDRITDFVSGSDWIYVSQIGFGGGLAAVLTADQFTLGTAATTTNHRFIYNQGTGALFFDQDGTGGIAQVQIAQLTGAPTLTASDIVIF